MQIEARVAPFVRAHPPAPFDSQIPVCFRIWDGFLGLVVAEFEFVCTHKLVCFDTSRKLSPLFAMDSGFARRKNNIFFPYPAGFPRLRNPFCVPSGSVLENLVLRQL